MNLHILPFGFHIPQIVILRLTEFLDFLDYLLKEQVSVSILRLKGREAPPQLGLLERPNLSLFQKTK
jgi:hypothetical protein